MKQGTRLCYHCGKKFSVNKRTGRTIFMLVVCTILICANVFIFITTENFNIITLLTNLAVITVAVLMLPLTVRFKAEKFTKSEKKTILNNHKHTGKNKS